MAGSPNPRTIYSNDILYETYPRLVWANVCGRTWEQALANAQSVVIPEVTPNAVADNPADTDALEAAPGEVSKATVSGHTMTMGWVRGRGRVGIADTIISGGGPGLEQRVNDDIARQMATNLDNKISAAVGALTYDAVDGTGNDNLLTVGATGTTYIDSAFPYGVTNAANMDILEAFTDAILNARALLTDKNVMDGEVIGAGAPTGAAVLIAPTGLTLNIVRYLKRTGQLTTRESIAGQALVEGGIASNTAFAGRLGDIDIVTNNGFGKAVDMIGAGDDQPWRATLVPVGGPIQFALFPPAISDRRFEDGTTDDRYFNQRTAISRYAVLATRPEHVIQIRVAADNDAS